RLLGSASIDGRRAELITVLDQQVAQRNADARMRYVEGDISEAAALERSIGVYGVPMPDVIDEATIPLPTLSYGAQKLIGEYLVSDYGRRGFVDGRSVRIPGIVARPPAAKGLLSLFLSDLIRELSAGRSFICP